MKRCRAAFGLFGALLACGALVAQEAGPRGLLRGVEAVATPGVESAMAPSVAPDGRRVAFTGPRFQGLYLLEVESGKVTLLDGGAGAGFRPSWCEDGRSVAFRLTLGRDRRKHLVVVGHPDGVKEPATPLVNSLSLPFWRGRQVWAFRQDGPPRLLKAGPGEESAPTCPVPVATPEGRLLLVDQQGASREVTSPPGKVFYLPVISGDGRVFVAHCLDGHLYLGDTEGGTLKDLGPGSWASFVRGDRALLFQRTADDGHALTAGDIFLMDLATGAVEAVTATPDRIELHPSMAADGHTLYFDADGAIRMGWVP